MAYTIDIDTGGTYTDGYVHNGDSLFLVKVDTTPHDLVQCFLRCIDETAEKCGLTDRRELFRETAVIRFSTTLCNNLLHQKRGPKVGVIVTKGYEDSLYGSEKSLYDSILDPALVVGIREDIDEKGDVSIEPETDDVTLATRTLLLRGARVIVVVLKASHLNDNNEKKVKEILDQSYPPHYLGYVPVLLSHQILTDPSDNHRLNAAILNAYFHNELAQSLYRAEDALRESGYRRPLFVVHGNNGTARVAKTTAIDTYNSGPAAACYGSKHVARKLDLEQVITVDIGGTSTEIGIISGGLVRMKTKNSIAGFPIGGLTPDIDTLAAGGGSIAQVIEGHLAVGPNSAGALPGPACYNLGGTEVTVTDALLLAGFLNHDFFMGGTKKLDPEKSSEVINRCAGNLDMDSFELVTTIIDHISQRISEAIQQKTTGMDLTNFTLFAFGGCGGLFAARVAEIAGITKVLTFPFGSVFSAMGSSLLDVVHTYDTTLSTADNGWDVVQQRISELRQKASRELYGAGIPEAEVKYRLEFELIDGGNVSFQECGYPEDLSDLATILSGVSLSTINRIRLKSVLVIPHHEPSVRRSEAVHSPQANTTRQVFWGKEAIPTPVYRFDGYTLNSIIEGPAIIEQIDTTIAVPSGWQYHVNTDTIGILERK